MTEDAKRAAKIEKKLKVLLGGYQVRIFFIYLLCGILTHSKALGGFLVTVSKTTKQTAWSTITNIS